MLERMRFHEIGSNEIWRKQILHPEVMGPLSDACMELFQSSEHTNQPGAQRTLSSMLCSYKLCSVRTQEVGWAIKSTGCSAGGPAFRPQHVHDRSRSSVTPVSGDQSPSSDLCRNRVHSVHALAYMHAQHPHPTTPPHKRTQDVTSHTITFQLLLGSC